MGLNANAQCNYIPSTSTGTDTLSFTFFGGSFESYGCAPIDPTYWFSGNGSSVTITFVNPQSYPTFRVWGMNDDDSASVSVNNGAYTLNSSSASYDAKKTCGLSPGPDGVTFSGGNLVGVNNNTLGNYSYQNVQLNVTNVTTIKLTGISGLGWGFAGVSVNCPSSTDINTLNTKGQEITIFPNPFSTQTTLHTDHLFKNASLTVYNFYGQTVKQIKNISGQTVNVFRDNLPTGLYFIRLTEDNKVIAEEKLVITD